MREGGSVMRKPAPASGADGCPQRAERRKGPRSSIMNVGRRVDYAIRALCYLAAQPPGRIVRGAEIQERQNIPPHFLSKILRSLVGAELLASVPGAHGGFRLGRPAHDISVRAVYESIQGQLSLIDCVDQHEAFCSFAPVCTQLQIWSGAQKVLSQYLERISIGDIADGSGLVQRLREAAPRRLRRPPRPVRAT
jgi:Rrf2 family protein